MKKTKVITRLSVLVLAALFLNACNISDDPKPSYPKNVSIEYKVSGTGLSKIEILRYTNATGGTTSLSEATIPFSVSFNRMVDAGDDLVLSVLHSIPSSTDPLSVKLEIYVDNKLVETETYEGSGRVSGTVVHIF